MTYIPNDIEWYLAEIVEQFKVEGESGSTVHVNFVLVRAHTPEQAFDKAIRIGAKGKESYRNSDGGVVTPKFVGLRNLHPIYEPLEDGSEILYEKYPDASDMIVSNMVKPKEKLNVFNGMNDARPGTG